MCCWLGRRNTWVIFGLRNFADFFKNFWSFNYYTFKLSNRQGHNQFWINGVETIFFFMPLYIILWWQRDINLVGCSLRILDWSTEKHPSIHVITILSLNNNLIINLILIHFYMNGNSPHCGFEFRYIYSKHRPYLFCRNVSSHKHI